MFDNKRTMSPTYVFLAGLGTAALGALLAQVLVDASGMEAGRSLFVGFSSAAAAAAVAASQRRSTRAASLSLSQAANEAKVDPLTGLANRVELYRALDESISTARADNTVFGVLFLDLDRFKIVNDSLGHDAGDELLRIVADRLRAATRSSDVVARLGGDEFVVLCRGLLAADSVEAVAAQVLKRLSEPVSLNGRSHLITASIGVSVAASDDTRDADDLIRDADAAMYKAKRDRSGYCVFDDAQRSMLIDRLDIERDLGRAIDEKQLEVYYQPIVRVSTGHLYGFEALVRWDHPERGFVTPGEFLPIAEDARLMAKIGELVLREACAQAAVWNHLCPQASTLRVSVNVAEQQLTNSDLPQLVSDTLAWAGLDPSQLVLEITEDVMVEHLDGLTVLRRLRDLGVHLAIDDFGTGQSSLSYIKEFDMVATLKIDQSFVADMHLGGANQAIIEAIVAMASALDLAIVAEGVEDDSQLKALSALGVDLMQGFLFDRPVAAETLGSLDNWFSGLESDQSAGLRSAEIAHGLATGRLVSPQSTPAH